MHRWFGAIGHLAIDICLWDLVGKRLDRPVWRLLGGGYRERLPAYASTLHMPNSPSPAPQLGFRAFKIHGWGKSGPRDEAANILHCRKAVDDRLVLSYHGGSEPRRPRG